MKTITYYPLFVEWNAWMDGYVRVDDEVRPFDFISTEIAEDDSKNGDAVYPVQTIVLEEFSAASAVAALAHWYSRELDCSIRAVIDSDDVECTVIRQA